ncbi:ester cyclase [Nonomuraea fuscirosea]|uniref:ester cyclase n=1 Tax=Nonomuraea fuscirosea TaxID=1291556 RepID=UPI00341FE473
MLTQRPEQGRSAASDSNIASRNGTYTGANRGPLILPDGRPLEGTGRRITLRATCAAHVANGQIISHREYYDQLELYSQLGFGLVKLDSARA